MARAFSWTPHGLWCCVKRCRILNIFICIELTIDWSAVQNKGALCPQRQHQKLSAAELNENLFVVRLADEQENNISAKHPQGLFYPEGVETLKELYGTRYLAFSTHSFADWRIDADVSYIVSNDVYRVNYFKMHPQASASWHLGARATSCISTTAKQRSWWWATGSDMDVHQWDYAERVSSFRFFRVPQGSHQQRSDLDSLKKTCWAVFTTLCRALQRRVVETARNITRMARPSMEDLYTQCRNRTMTSPQTALPAAGSTAWGPAPPDSDTASSCRTKTEEL